MSNRPGSNDGAERKQASPVPSFDENDSFYCANSANSPRPPERTAKPLPGDRLLLIGDSITEARRFSRIVESYYLACVPHLGLEVRMLGKGGETAEQFTRRMDEVCQSRPTDVAVVCYGMNDAGYCNRNPEGLARYGAALTTVLAKLQAAHTRIVLSSPGCMGRLPPWQFVEEQGGTLDGLNGNLLQFRDQAARLAEAEHLPFVDHFWNLYRARLASAARHDADFAICGLDDGVHPSTAGHVIMAHGVLTALGMRGELGCLTIDLGSRTGSATDGHAFVAEKEHTYTFESTRYPFCANGPDDRDWSVRGGCGLVPFMRDFSRLRLVVTGGTGTYRVAWMNSERMLEESHIYSAQELANGINLADDFVLNPFSRYFQRVESLVHDKQGIESQMTWLDRSKHTPEECRNLLADLEQKRLALIAAARAAVVPVTHNLRLLRID